MKKGQKSVMVLILGCLALTFLYFLVRFETHRIYATPEFEVAENELRISDAVERIVGDIRSIDTNGLDSSMLTRQGENGPETVYIYNFNVTGLKQVGVFQTQIIDSALTRSIEIRQELDGGSERSLSKRTDPKLSHP